MTQLTNVARLAPVHVTVAAVLLAAGTGVEGRQAPADAKAQEIFALVAAATGSDAGSLGSLVFEADTRRVMGEREIAGTLTMRVLFPDRFQRVDEMEMPGGQRAGSMTRTLDGDEVWMDQAGGGFVMRGFGGPGGAGGGPGGPGMFGRGGPPAGAEPGAAGRRGDMASTLRGEFYRVLLGIAPGAAAAIDGLAFAYVGEAHADDGQVAEVIDVTGERFSARLFVDQATHLPLMMTYEAPQVVRVMGAGGPGGAAGRAERGGGGPPSESDREAIRRQLEAEGPPPLVEHRLFFSNYEREAGLLVPRTIVRHVDGEVEEQWTITTVELNPPLDPERFRNPRGSN